MPDNVALPGQNLLETPKSVKRWWLLKFGVLHIPDWSCSRLIASFAGA
jgi:hypothetical protein